MNHLPRSWGVEDATLEGEQKKGKPSKGVEMAGDEMGGYAEGTPVGSQYHLEEHDTLEDQEDSWSWLVPLCHKQADPGSLGQGS